jgi:two-component system, NtrC family, nitrogen regulation response regulator GlnG
MIVDDDAAVCWALRQALTQNGFTVAVAATTARARILAHRQRPALVITDLRMPGGDGLDLLSVFRREFPGVPVVLTTAYGSLDVAVQASERGAFGYLPKPLDLERTLDLARRACGRQRLAISVAADQSHPGLVGSSPLMQEVYRRIAAAAASNVAVLIHGPSGTGKELVARNIHRFSARADGPFVAVNCGAIPAALVESELFGHVAGAFTGATQARSGRFQSATCGVLFLDEVGDLPLAVQASLLRFLDNHRVTPVGGNEESQLDVRVIAASNRPLSGTNAVLRTDLFYRLRGVTIATPAIAERPEDLPALITALLVRTARRLGRTVSVTEDALATICAQSWPGNVRQLKHCLEEAAVFAPGGIIATEHLGFNSVDTDHHRLATLVTALTRQAMTIATGNVYEHCMNQARAPLLRQVLAHTHGNYVQAGELLGINRVTLKRWTDEHSLSINDAPR